MSYAYCPRCRRRLLLDRESLEWICSCCSRRYPPAWVDHGGTAGAPTYVGPPGERRRVVVEHPPEPEPKLSDRLEVPGLRAVRKERRMRQEKLAQALGVSRVSISWWESRRYTVEAAVVFRMAAILDVHVSRLTNLQ